MYYVYRYAHELFPYLYIGITDNMERRMREHDKSALDNIEICYRKLIQESEVQYIEVHSKAEARFIEEWLIRKHRPNLNKESNNGDYTAEYDIRLPDWKVYADGIRKCTQIKSECKDVSECFITEHNEHVMRLFMRLVDLNKYDGEKVVWELESLGNEFKIDTDEKSVIRFVSDVMHTRIAMKDDNLKLIHDYEPIHATMVLSPGGFVEIYGDKLDEYAMLMRAIYTKYDMRYRYNVINEYIPDDGSKYYDACTEFLEKFVV